VIAQLLNLQHVPHTREPQAVAAGDQDVEEGMMERNESAVETPRRSRLQRRRSRQLVEGGDEARFPAHVARVDGVPQTQLLDLDARGGQIAQVLGGDRGDAKAALWARFDQSFRCQPGQRFAHGSLTGVEPFAQLADSQWFTRL